jgi:epoxyqueuosine reductase QueG
VALRHHVVATLAEVGIPAVAPMVSEFWSRSDQGPYAPCSNWSERHAAYAAGLGTFGLCDGLITPVGKAMRTGSVVVRLAVEPTQRPYDDHHAYCLFYSQGTCGKCIPRCPVNALSADGHDKKRCLQYTEFKMNAYTRETFDIDTYACGLCQAGVPCMDHIPGPDEG